MDQVKVIKLFENLNINSDLPNGGIHNTIEPIYIGAPTQIKLIWEVKDSVNLDLNSPTAALPVLTIEGSVSNKAQSIWSVINDNTAYPDPITSGEARDVYVFRRFSKYQVPSPSGKPLLLPWIKPKVYLLANTPPSGCAYASITSSLTLIAEYD